MYCLKDAYLPLRLLDKLMCVINYMEMARVTGVPLSYLQTRGQQIKVVSRNVFTLDTCAQIVGSQVISCGKEQELLEKWASFVRECDPDLITGYNINNFDLPYLLNRAKALKVPNFNYLGRIKDVQSVVKESVLQSKQMGRRENKNVNMEGRCAFDLLLILVACYILNIVMPDV